MTPAMIQLHRAWNMATGQELPLVLCDYAREFGYHQFIQAGFGEREIVEVVRYLKRKIKEGSRLEGALRWSNCIGNITRFAEDLAMAKAEIRNTKPPMTPKERVIQQARPTVTLHHDTTNTAKPVSHWIAQLRHAAS